MQSANILVVEDDLLIQHKISSILQSEGYQVDACESAEESLERISTFDPDLVLMDIKLDGKMSGIDAAKIFNRKGVPIIYISDASESTTLKKAEKANPVEFLVKPFNNRQILVSTRRALELAASNKNHTNDLKIVKDSFFIHPVNDKLNRDRVKFEDIAFIQADRAYCTIHTIDKKKYVLSDNLKDVLSSLPDGVLYRVHRSYALNPKWITGLKGRNAIVLEAEIPITNPEVLKGFYKI